MGTLKSQQYFVHLVCLDSLGSELTLTQVELARQHCVSMGLKGEKEDKIQKKKLTNAWKHERKGLSGKFKEFGIVDTSTVPGPGGGAQY